MWPQMWAPEKNFAQKKVEIGPTKETESYFLTPALFFKTPKSSENFKRSLNPFAEKFWGNNSKKKTPILLLKNLSPKIK